MLKIRNMIVALLLVSPFGVSQQRTTRIQPPQPNYEIYGSYSRQLRVYEATQRRLDRLDRQRYRKFRQEVRRNLPKHTSRVVVRRNTYEYGDALQSWRNRRNSSGRQR